MCALVFEIELDRLASPMMVKRSGNTILRASKESELCAIKTKEAETKKSGTTHGVQKLLRNWYMYRVYKCFSK